MTDMTLELQHYKTLREAICARQVFWTGQVEVPLNFWLAELAGEVGEMCNIIKKIWREKSGIAGSRATVEQLTEELADVIICVDLVLRASDERPVNLELISVSKKIRVIDDVLGCSRSLVKSLGYMMEQHTEIRTRGAAFDIVWEIFRIADFFEIDIIPAVASKFNYTSRKMNIPVRMMVDV